MSRLTFRWIGTWDGRLARLVRFTWLRGIGPGVDVKRGWSAKFTVALTRRWFAWMRTKRPEPEEWILVLFGVRLHYLRSYGGRIAP